MLPPKFIESLKLRSVKVWGMASPLWPLIDVYPSLDKLAGVPAVDKLAGVPAVDKLAGVAAVTSA